MIFDEVAEVMRNSPMREVRKKTGLSYDKIKRLREGCPFVLDYDTLFALERLGFDLKLVEKKGRET